MFRYRLPLYGRYQNTNLESCISRVLRYVPLTCIVVVSEVVLRDIRRIFMHVVCFGNRDLHSDSYSLYVSIINTRAGKLGPDSLQCSDQLRYDPGNFASATIGRTLSATIRYVWNGTSRCLKLYSGTPPRPNPIVVVKASSVFIGDGLRHFGGS